MVRWKGSAPGIEKLNRSDAMRGCASLERMAVIGAIVSTDLTRGRVAGQKKPSVARASLWRGFVDELELWSAT
jgi:hypothetical protein